MTTSVQAKERPILFSGAMVRAILEGRKTQTRRVIKDQDCVEPLPDSPNTAHFVHHAHCPGFCDYACGGRFAEECISPYGTLGDRLWVRETLGVVPNWGTVHYVADDAKAYEPETVPRNEDAERLVDHYGDVTFANEMQNIPSIFMPRWASRITLEITGVRVERVQNISDSDATAEGLYTANECHTVECGSPGTYDPDQKCKCGSRSPQEEYKALWDSINAKRGFGWDTNPWVWVIEFKKC